MINTVGIVSLSSGIMGESFIRFEVDIGIRRLKKYGLNVKLMPHALMGLDYIKAHPEKGAEDLLQAFRDPEIDMILCAIGGDDTYRLMPYLFDHYELANAVTNKLFLGFSDTTINHLVLHKVGLNTFYGQAFLPDICELSQEMHPYTRKYFEELISTGTIKEITPIERNAFHNHIHTKGSTLPTKEVGSRTITQTPLNQYRLGGISSPVDLSLNIDCDPRLEFHSEVVGEDGDLLDEIFNQSLIKLCDVGFLPGDKVLQLLDPVHAFFPVVAGAKNVQ